MMRKIFSAVAGVLLLASTTASACVCCFYAVVDPGEVAKTSAAAGSATTITGLLVTAKNLYSKISDAVGQGGAIQTRALPSLTANPPNLSSVTAISVPGGGALPAPQLGTFSQAQSWTQQAYYTTATDSGSLSAITARRNAAFAAAARTGYAVALASRQNIGNTPQQMQQLLQLGDSAPDIRTQIAAVAQTIEAVRAEIVALQRVDEAMLELSSADVLLSSPTSM